jgi:hypothetical protein
VTPKHRVAYSTPAAFRRALTDKLRALASTAGSWPLPDLQRQFAYDRLLARLYLLDDRWILKGSTRFSRATSLFATRLTSMFIAQSAEAKRNEICAGRFSSMAVTGSPSKPVQAGRLLTELAARAYQ